MLNDKPKVNKFLLALIICLALASHYQSIRLVQLSNKNKDSIKKILSYVDHLEKRVLNKIDNQYFKNYTRLKNSNNQLLIKQREYDDNFRRINSSMISSDLEFGLISGPIPTAHYRCDDQEGRVLKDDMIGQNHGQTKHSMNKLSIAGHLNGAVHFFHREECVNIDTLTEDILNDDQGTWTLWVNRNYGEDGHLISFSDNDSDSYFGIALRFPGILSFGFQGRGREPGWQGTAKLFEESHEWIHFALVQDGIAPKFYKNANEVEFEYLLDSDRSYWFNQFPNFDSGRIGCLNKFNSEENFFYHGKIDDIRYYSQALSPKEIKLIYNQGVGTEDTFIELKYPQ